MTFRCLSAGFNVMLSISTDSVMSHRGLLRDSWLSWLLPPLVYSHSVDPRDQHPFDALKRGFMGAVINSSIGLRESTQLTANPIDRSIAFEIFE
jgi:hypothetical protein